MVALDVIPQPAALGHAEDRAVIFRPLRFKNLPAPPLQERAGGEEPLVALPSRTTDGNPRSHVSEAPAPHTF